MSGGKPGSEEGSQRERGPSVTFGRPPRVVGLLRPERSVPRSVLHLAGTPRSADRWINRRRVRPAGQALARDPREGSRISREAPLPALGIAGEPGSRDVGPRLGFGVSVRTTP